MQPLPAADIRSNVLTLAVPNNQLPAIGRLMTLLLPTEKYDPVFQGQHLDTTYFDTHSHLLRKARLKAKKYLTLRIRNYNPGDTYALSAKTEDRKFRVEIDEATAQKLLSHNVDLDTLAGILPADLLARLMELIDDQPLRPIACVSFTRYAVEDRSHRITLDCGITSNTGKQLTNILEQKAAGSDPRPMEDILQLNLPSVKLSKFLWATTYGAR